MNIETELVEIGDIDIAVTFPSDATLHFLMSFTVPEIMH